jgi:hypothetical protein
VNGDVKEVFLELWKGAAPDGGRKELHDRNKKVAQTLRKKGLSLPGAFAKMCQRVQHSLRQPSQ